jgi:dihydroxyacetone kinase-like protein
MNVRIALEMAEEAGLVVKTVVADDDVPSAPATRACERRGVAGEILMWKVGGAKAALGADLDEVVATARKAIANTRSMGIGLAPCTIPEVGHPNFDIADGMMEVGIGHHGEPGIEIAPLESSSRLAERMLDAILPDLPFLPRDKVAVLVSGLGSTPLMEQFIFFNDVARRLDSEGIHIHRSYVGNYFTSLEMNGITLTLMKLDGELEDCLDLETDSYGLCQLGPQAGKR